MTLLLLLRESAPPQTGTGTITGASTMSLSLGLAALGARAVSGAAELATTVRLSAHPDTPITPPQESTPVTAQAELVISLDFRLSQSAVGTITGGAWTALILNVLEGGLSTTVGAAELGVTLAENLNGVVSPGAIETIQHQGAAILSIRAEFDTAGNVHPVIVVPPQAQNGTAQMSIGLAFAAGHTQVNLGDTTVLMRLAFEAGGQLGRAGEVLAHPQQLGVEFGVTREETVVVHIPRVTDWGVLRARGGTPEFGDPEYF